MAEIVSKHGYYWGYHEVCEITGAKIFKFDSRNNVTMYYDLHSTMSGGQPTNTVTLDNVSDAHLQGIKEGSAVKLYSGCTDLFAQAAKGFATKVVKGRSDNNHTCTISFDSSSKKSKPDNTKLKKSFAKNTKAKTIIGYIQGKAQYKIEKLKLKKNMKYKRGYTLTSTPYDELRKIVQDCGSVMYQRNGSIIIDDNSQPNLFGEHLYLDYGAGLLAEPGLQDGATTKKKKVQRQWTITAMEDVRINAGSAVYIEPLKKLCKVQSAHHIHDSDGYRMELIVS